MGSYLITEIDKKSKIARIAFNKPEKLNATNDEDLIEVRSSFR